MNTARLIETRGQPVFQETEEGVDGGEPGVARPSRVPAVGLDVFEEGKDKRSVELFDLESIRFDPEPVRGEAYQNAKAVSVGFAGVRACPSLPRQMLAEERTKVRSERGHAAPPWWHASPASAICCMRKGVA